jgi:hypothetical protein
LEVADRWGTKQTSPIAKSIEVYNTTEDEVFKFLTDIHYKKPIINLIKVITKLPNSEQSYKGKVQTVSEYGTALTNILPILFLYLNTVTVTTGAFEP